MSACNRDELTARREASTISTELCKIAFRMLCCMNQHAPRCHQINIVPSTTRLPSSISPFKQSFARHGSPRREAPMCPAAPGDLRQRPACHHPRTPLATNCSLLGALATTHSAVPVQALPNCLHAGTAQSNASIASTQPSFPPPDSTGCRQLIRMAPKRARPRAPSI